VNDATVTIIVTYSIKQTRQQQEEKEEITTMTRMRTRDRPEQRNADLLKTIHINDTLNHSSGNV
jgi:hypothetical protein